MFHTLTRLPAGNKMSANYIALVRLGVALATASSSTVAISPTPGRFLRIVKRVLLGIVILVVAALFCGALYQAIANWRDSRRFPQEGRSVALGAAFPGVSLSMNCTGQGSPIVIMDTGLG